MIRDLVVKNRSYRRFDEKVDIKIETLRELVDLARLSASAMNAQPLKYILSCDRQKNSLIFPHLVWAAFLKTWPGPSEGERPSGYIVILGDTDVRRFCEYDAGIALNCASVHDAGLKGAHVWISVIQAFGHVISLAAAFASCFLDESETRGSKHRGDDAPNAQNVVD